MAKDTKETTTPKTKTTAGGFPSTPISVEIMAPNGYVLFKHRSERLRGRWSVTNEIGKTSSKGLTAMPDIDGQYVTLDCTNRSLEISDPLGQDEALLERVNQIHEDVFSTSVKPIPTIYNTDLSDDEIKSVLYEIARWVTAGTARVTAGNVPSVEEVAHMKGNRYINYFDTDPSAPRQEADPDLRGSSGLATAFQLGQK